MKKITFTAWAVPLLWMLTSILGSYTLYAQSQPWVVSGVVTDEQSQPLEGVVVWQPHTDSQTLTNELGYYTLSIEKEEAIHFEYLGYQTVVRKASGSVLNVSLKPSDEELDEIIINAGYYNVSDKERTGSISRITAKEISQQPVANPLAAMQGRMAGVNITQNSGVPGGGFDIQIRGRNSLRTEGNAPLYIVDGVPYPSQSVSDISLSAPLFAGNVSPLNSINPNVIESIEVLKDADATAIYGSRGSNGVVLITTKKGAQEKIKFSINSSTAMSKVSNFVEMMNTQTYLKMRKDAFSNDGFNEYPVNAYDVNGTWDEDRYTDWQETLLGKTAVTQLVDATIQSGNLQNNFIASLSNREESTVFYGDSKYRRKSAVLNYGHQSKDRKFKINFSNSFAIQNNRLPATDLSKVSRNLAPNAPDLYTSEGKLNWENNTFDNPLASLENKYLSKSNQLISNFQLQYQLFSKLSFKLNAGYTYFTQEEKRLLPSTAYNPSLNIGSERSSVFFGDRFRETWIMEPQLQFDLQKENNKWNVLFGITFEEHKNSNYLIYASNFANNHFINNISAAQQQQVMQDVQTLYRYHALFGRLNYMFTDKYIVNITGRRDGSSRFGPNNRFANFAAVGGAWLFSHENIFNEMNWLSYGKIRSSYGIAGNDLIGDYQYLDTYSTTSNVYDGINGLVPSKLYNPEFSWENNKKFEVAIEMAFLQNAISFELGWYRNRSSNQLVGVPLPGTTGFTSVTSNLNAIVENSGIELQMTVIPLLKSELNWRVILNFTRPKNKLIAFPNLEDSSYANQFVIGESIYGRKMYNYLGIDPVTGKYIFEDYNNDGIISEAEDKRKWVTVGQKYFGGITNSFSYKKLQLDFTWQFVNQTNYSPIYNSPLLGSMNNQPAMLTDYWSPNAYHNQQEGPTTGGDREKLTRIAMYRESSAMVVNANYLRLKNVNLSYPVNLSSNIEAVFQFQAQNLITITNYWGVDPEFNNTGYLPPLRTISFGCNLKF